MEEKVQKLVAELKRSGTLDHWRSQLIDSFMASGAAAEVKRKTREFVSSSPDLNPIYLQKPDIAKRQLFSLLMNSTRQKSGILQDLELSLKDLIDKYEQEIPPKWQEQMQKAFDKIENISASSDDLEPPAKRAKLSESTDSRGESEPTLTSSSQDNMLRFLPHIRQSSTPTPPPASSTPTPPPPSHHSSSSGAANPKVSGSESVQKTTESKPAPPPPRPVAPLSPEPQEETKEEAKPSLSEISAPSLVTRQEKPKPETSAPSEPSTTAAEAPQVDVSSSAEIVPKSNKGTVLGPEIAPKMASSAAKKTKKKNNKKIKKRKMSAKTPDDDDNGENGKSASSAVVGEAPSGEVLERGEEDAEDSLVDIGGGSQE